MQAITELLTGLGVSDFEFFAGDNDDNLLEGGDTLDAILGFAGNDVLRGNDELDILLGGRGNDHLTGG